MDATAFPYDRVRQGDTRELRAWLERGGQIDAPLLTAEAETWTPLMLACAEGDVRTVRAIIEIGGARASACMETKVLVSCTPLHVACRYGNAGVATTLLELGALVDAHDTIGMTPLHFAVAKGHMSRPLTQNMYRLKQKGYSLWPLFMPVVFRTHEGSDTFVARDAIRTIDVLLSAGADAYAEGPGGATAYDVAKMAGYSDACALLKKYSQSGKASTTKRKALRSWLEWLGCEEFLGRLLRAGYDDLRFLAEQGLTEADLDCIGVPREKLGLRRKMLVMHGVEQFLDNFPGRKGKASPATSRSRRKTRSEIDESSMSEMKMGESSDSSSDESESSGSSLGGR